jgi:N-acyl homoserine lactone hydrolase
MQESRATLERIWSRWRRQADTLLIPGHDLCMRLDDKGEPVYVGERRAAMNAWFGENLEPIVIDLCCGGETARYSA